MSPVDYIAEAKWLKVMAHPVRLEILERLLGGERCVTEVEQLVSGLTQSSLSQHLALLRHCGVVDCRREGNKRCYFLVNPQMIARLLAALRDEPILPWETNQPIL